MDVEIPFLRAVGPLVEYQGAETGRGLIACAVQEAEKSLADKLIPDQLLLFLPGCYIDHGGKPQPLEILKVSDAAQ